MCSGAVLSTSARRRADDAVGTNSEKVGGFSPRRVLERVSAGGKLSDSVACSSAQRPPDKGVTLSSRSQQGRDGPEGAERVGPAADGTRAAHLAQAADP